MKLFPAIDLRDGHCVRLFQGDYDQTTVYSADPVAVAASFVEAGAEWIHVVDLDGAKAGKPCHLELIAEMKGLGVHVQTGGGYRDFESIERALSVGIDRVILGSALLKSKELKQESGRRFGERVVAGLDVREGKVAISGWQEQTEVGIVELGLELVELGYVRMIVTDIATDGAFTGPNLALANEVMAKVPMHYIVSGGVAGLQDVLNVAETSAEGVIVGKAIYEGKFSVADFFATQTRKEQ